MTKLPLRVLDRHELREMVPYSYQHILRLEKAGRFPKRVKLGAARVGWILDEVLAWVEERIAEREKSLD
jgi:prophage regulatory protein